MHLSNSYITLTYNDEHLPANASLDVTDWQKFMKRLRKKHGKMRFFHCGEYGDVDNRPHFHACLFGFQFGDLRIWKQNKNGDSVYRSRQLEEIWTSPETGKVMGFCTVGQVSFQSAAYVARYIMKKVNGKKAADHYMGKKPEYVTMSRKPGLATSWIRKYWKDVYPHDYVVTSDGRKRRTPSFYDRYYEKLDPDGFSLVHARRKLATKNHAEDNSPERLAVREAVLSSKLIQLKREL